MSGVSGYMTVIVLIVSPSYAPLELNVTVAVTVAFALSARSRRKRVVYTSSLVWSTSIIVVCST
jgi:hypothetical protein